MPPNDAITTNVSPVRKAQSGVVRGFPDLRPVVVSSTIGRPQIVATILPPLAR